MICGSPETAAESSSLGHVVSWASFWKASSSSWEVREGDAENQAKQSGKEDTIQEAFIDGALTRLWKHKGELPQALSTGPLGVSDCIEGGRQAPEQGVGPPACRSPGSCPEKASPMTEQEPPQDTCPAALWSHTSRVVAGKEHSLTALPPLPLASCSSYATSPPTIKVESFPDSGAASLALLE